MSRILTLTLSLSLSLCFGQSAYTTARTAPEKAVKSYNDARNRMSEADVAGAIRSYQKALEVDSMFVDAWLYLGGARYESHHWSEAERCFETALRIAPAYQPHAFYVCALTEWEQNKFSECADHIETYLRVTEPSEQTSRVRTEAKQMLENARFAAKAVQQPVQFNPVNMGPGVNSAASEYLPALTADGQTLIFTRLTGEGEDFFVSKRNAVDSEEWETAQPMEGVNTVMNEGAESISADGTWLVFTACNRSGDGSQGQCDLYWSQIKNGAWTKPVPFSAAINSRAWDGQPSISADGKTIYFSSDRDGSLGSKDIFYTTRDAGGKWSKPKNIGEHINTLGDEQTPFIHPDGQTLYFTSNGLPGMGGNDIYFIRRQPDGSWGKPQNLGYPVNTKAHEGTLCVSLDGKTAYFAAERPDGLGKLDIYRFEMPVAARPQAVTYARAKVTDAATGYPLVAKVEFTDLSTNQSFVTANTKSDGTFLVCLPAGKSYSLHVSRDKYLFHSENFDLTAKSTFEQPFTLNIELQPLPDSITKTTTPAKPVVLKNVFFATGSAELLPASQTELLQLADLMRNNPGLNIQINGHTDNVGDDASNLTLSEKRAQSVRDFLVGQKITAERIRARGFGETKPVATNETPEGRSLNRRTEFEVF